MLRSGLNSRDNDKKKILPQFGWDGDDKWKRRRDELFGLLHSNPKAKFVTRVVQFGSEPLYDNVLDPKDLAAQVRAAKITLTSLHIPVTISEMAYGWQEVWSILLDDVEWRITHFKKFQSQNNGAKQIMDAINVIDAHMLPFFSKQASCGRRYFVDAR